MAGTTLVDEKEIVEQLRDWSLQKLKITFVQVVRTCPEHAALVADEIYRRAVDGNTSAQVYIDDIRRNRRSVLRLPEELKNPAWKNRPWAKRAAK